MEPACGFSRGFVPSDDPSETILITHVRNCTDCQNESYLILPGAYAGA